jgi:hypothetical protein
MNVKTRSWKVVREHYDNLLIKHSWKSVAPIINLIDWIEKEGLDKELFATTSMAELVLSNQENFKWGENALHIASDSRTKKIKFTYYRLYASNDQMIKEVEEAEAQETLREFLGYKFGLYRKPECNKSVV